MSSHTGPMIQAKGAKVEGVQGGYNREGGGDAVGKSVKKWNACRYGIT